MPCGPDPVWVLSQCRFPEATYENWLYYYLVESLMRMVSVYKRVELARLTVTVNMFRVKRKVRKI